MKFQYLLLHNYIVYQKKKKNQQNTSKTDYSTHLSDCWIEEVGTHPEVKYLVLLYLTVSKGSQRVTLR